MILLDPNRHPALASSALGVSTGHVPVPLKRLRRAELLWLNTDEARLDPAWVELGGDASAYAAHLLDACAYEIARDGGAPDRRGVADRYGGGNIGTNGGSGRAVLVGPYYVKGVGRTPLVGLGVDEGHASGGAYLEECVRESLLGEILHRELPHGTVRTLAILTTGAVQVWNTEHGPKPERRCLLVRRAFLRPAHLERAPMYRGAEALPGMADAHRVRETIRALAEASGGGVEALQAQLTESFRRWSRQLASSYLLCLPHGGVSSSNAALDGRLVDFGATASVPSLARYWVASGNHPSGEEFRDIIDTVNGVACAFRFTAGQGEPARAWRSHACEQVMHAYVDGLRATLLQLVGLSCGEARALLDGASGRAAAQEIDRWLQPLRRQALPIFEGAPWHSQAMPEERSLQELEDTMTRVARHHGAPLPASDAETAARRRAVRARWTAPRMRLDRERLKDECYARLEGRHTNLPDLRKATAALIEEIVADEVRVPLTTVCSQCP
ncbi:MAG: hypothetical protein AB1430_02920 [Pseudomonadota bacterium]